jgi:HD superfamily phosphohydrolase
LQRLRGVRQLAMAYMVYPGALHTRFDHSLGVTHVAGLLVDKLLDPSARRLIRLASLLHDVGHGPFSHVSEQILEEFSHGVEAPIREKIHERLTANIIEHDAELADHIGYNTCLKVIQMLQGGGVESVERGIVSGPLDADKQDYLLRDSYFCGVKYGVFDLARLIDSLCLYDTGTERILAAKRAGVPAIEQFVMAKYYMAAQVYRHKLRLITDSMIVRALQLGIKKDNLPWLCELYSYDGTAKFIENFLQWDDARLLTALLHPIGTAGLATDILNRLQQRRLFKRVFSRNLRDFAEPLFRASFPNASNQTRTVIESEIAEYLSSQAGSRIDPDYVIVHHYGLKSVRQQSRNDEGSIIILDSDGPRKFEDASTLFRSIDESQNDQFVEIYAPYPFRSKVEQRKLGQKFQEDIASLLEKPFHSQLILPSLTIKNDGPIHA